MLPSNEAADTELDEYSDGDASATETEDLVVRRSGRPKKAGGKAFHDAKLGELFMSPTPRKRSSSAVDETFFEGEVDLRVIPQAEFDFYLPHTN